MHRCGAPDTKQLVGFSRLPWPGRPAWVHNDGVAKRPPDDDDALKVIDLFTDEPVTPRRGAPRDPDHDADADDRARPPRPRRNRTR